jgi:hypothetical protein
MAQVVDNYTLTEVDALICFAITKDLAQFPPPKDGQKARKTKSHPIETPLVLCVLTSPV